MYVMEMALVQWLLLDGSPLIDYLLLAFSGKLQTNCTQSFKSEVVGTSLFTGAYPKQNRQGAVHNVRHAIFLPILTPPPVTLCHTSRDTPKKYVTHVGPPIFSKPSTKIPDKSPLYKFYLNCSQRFLSVVFCPGWFLSIPLLSQYICYNRKLNITLNFTFHMYDKNLCKRDVTCS